MVFKCKVDDQENVSRFKARLVAKDYFQEEEAELYETFAPVVTFEVWVLLVGKILSEERHVPHADTSTAFFNGYMEGKRYVPWNIVVYKLRKS